MKKNLIIVPLLAIFVVSLLAGCAKVNVKKGEKKIIGTWTLTGENITSVSEEKDVTTYLPINNYYQDYNKTWKFNATSTISGTTETTVSSESETYTPDTYLQNYTNDTTISRTYTYEITFNENGTFKEIIANTQASYAKSKLTNNTYNSERIGTWEWVDAIEQKMGIRLTYDMYFDDIYIYSTILYIESLENETMKILVNTTEIISSNSEADAYQDIVKKTTFTSTYSESGDKTFTKKAN